MALLMLVLMALPPALLTLHLQPLGARPRGARPLDRERGGTRSADAPAVVLAADSDAVHPRMRMRSLQEELWVSACGVRRHHRATDTERGGLGREGRGTD